MNAMAKIPDIEAAPTALELCDLHKSFGPTPIIRGVSLGIARGERHAMIGPNGAGKSTLFNLISGRFAPTAGSIRLNGEEVSGGTHVRPATGYLCLESEGAPVEFKELRIRELP